jgi:hypothetical protein
MNAWICTFIPPIRLHGVVLTLPFFYLKESCIFSILLWSEENNSSVIMFVISVIWFLGAWPVSENEKFWYGQTPYVGLYVFSCSF